MGNGPRAPYDRLLLPAGEDTEHTRAAVAALRRALEDPAVELRREAALALGQLRDVESAGPLVKALSSDSEPVRRAAALALGRIDTPEARKALLDALAGDLSVWRQAAVALSHQHSPEVIESLTELLSNAEADEHARRGAALALGALLAEEPLSIEATASFEDTQGKLHVLF